MDDQRPFLMQWANVVLADPQAARYVSGVAFHWYMNTMTSPNVLEEFHQKYPGFFTLSSESCIVDIMSEGKVSLGNWLRAEEYARDIITDLLGHTSAWIDWNMALDTNGGPNWAKNYVDSPIIVDGHAQTYYKQPMYYALAHFTRFLPPGSRRLDFTSKYDKALDVLVFEQAQTGATVVVVLNRYESDVPFELVDERSGHLSLVAGKHSIQTIVWYN